MLNRCPGGRIAIGAWRRALVLLLTAAGAALATHRSAQADAADDPPAISVAGITLGSLVSGPARTPESLAHRVVVLEFWGVNCPPCIKSMPALESLHRQLGPGGLVVIGAAVDVHRSEQARTAHGVQGLETGLNGRKHLPPFPLDGRAIWMQLDLETGGAENPFTGGDVGRQMHSHTDWNHTEIDDHFHWLVVIIPPIIRHRSGSLTGVVALKE
jgi:thiol-disulfide isomerase/thioredoxin